MPAPVGHTCPDIDRVIKHINNALKIANDGMKMREKESDDWSMYDEIDSELGGLESDLEGLRESNSKLREWGEEAEELIESLENDYINANTERLELRKELETLKLKYENGIV